MRGVEHLSAMQASTGSSLKRMSQQVSQLEQQQHEDAQRIRTLNEQVAQLGAELLHVKSVHATAKPDHLPNQAATPLQEHMQVPATQTSGESPHSQPNRLSP